MKNKHLIIAALFMLAAKLATAQTEKGTQTLGINLTLQHSDSNGTAFDNASNVFAPQSNKYTTLGAGVDYSYFIADKLDVAAQFTYEHQSNYSSTDTYTQKQINNNYDATIFLRKYFMCSDKFGFRAGPYAGYIKGNETQDYGVSFPGTVTYSGSHYIEGGLRLEMVYYPVKRLGLSVMLADANYSHGNDHYTGNSSKDTSNDYNLNLLTNITEVSMFYVFR